MSNETLAQLAEQDSSTPTSRSADSRWSALFRPVDASFLNFFRICFGAVMAWQAIKFLARGWVKSYYQEPELFFSYFGFDWVGPWPGDGMVYHFVAMAVSAICVAAGVFYRTSALLLLLLTTHWFLIDTTHYNNHYYLECLICLLLVFMPAQRGFSFDAWRKPQLRKPNVPAWTLWLLRAQVGIVYFYGGLAKFDPDWLTGIPIRAILGDHGAESAIGSFVRSESGGHLLAYGGLLLDLLVVPFLLWRKTRLPAFLVALAFHLSNAYLFRIGIFPWFMAAATLIFFEPDWPRRFWAKLRRDSQKPVVPSPVEAPSARPGARSTTVFLLALYLAIQLLVPFRHHLYPGRVTWSEEGLRFSWHMMLSHKVAKAEFRVVSAQGEVLPVEFDWPISARQWEFMQYEPAAILQFAHFLADKAREQGFRDFQVRALCLCSLNGREPQLLVDPQRDLASEQESWSSFDWVVPLEQALPPESPYGGRLDERR